jgi:hypothetical protein
MSTKTRSPQARAVRTCRKKVAYADLGKALLARARFYTDSRTELEPYRCNVCGQWHLFSLKGGERPDGDTLGVKV